MLSIPYAISSHGGGQKTGRLVLETDSTNESFKQLTFSLSAELPRVIWASPEALFFKKPHSDLATQDLRIESDIQGLFDSATKIQTSRDLVTVRVKERGPSFIILQVTLRPDAPTGDAHDLIRLTIDDSRCSGLSVRIRSIVREPVAPASLK